MSQRKTAPETAETYRHFIKMLVDEISDAYTLWVIYTIVLGRWKRSGNN